MWLRVCCCLRVKGRVFVSTVALCAVKPKQRKIRFTEHDKILQTTLESFVNRVRVITCHYTVIADRINESGNAIASVRPSVRLTVICMHSIF